MRLSANLVAWLFPLSLVMAFPVSAQQSQLLQLANKNGHNVVIPQAPLDGAKLFGSVPNCYVSLDSNGILGTSLPCQPTASSGSSLSPVLNGAINPGFLLSSSAYVFDYARTDTSTPTTGANVAQTGILAQCAQADAGFSLGSTNAENPGGWLSHACETMNILDQGAGISNGFTVVQTHLSSGDSNPNQSFTILKPGWKAGSDQGWTGMSVVSKNAPDAIFTYSGSTGSGATSFVGSCVSNCGYVGVWQPLVDVTSSQTGTITGISSSGSLPGVAVVGVSGMTLGTSTCGLIASQSQIIDVAADSPVTLTLTITGLTSALTSGRWSAIGPQFGHGSTFTVVTPYSGGSETIQVSSSVGFAPFAQSSGIFCSGGTQGFASFSLIDSTVNTKILVYVIGSAPGQLFEVYEAAGNSATGGIPTYGSTTLYDGALVTNPGNSCQFINWRGTNFCAYNPNQQVSLTVTSSGHNFTNGHTYQLMSIAAETQNPAIFSVQAQNPFSNNMVIQSNIITPTFSNSRHLILSNPPANNNADVGGPMQAPIQWESGPGAGPTIVLDSYPTGSSLYGYSYSPALMQIGPNRGWQAGSTNTFFDLFVDHYANNCEIRYTPGTAAKLGYYCGNLSITGLTGIETLTPIDGAASYVGTPSLPYKTGSVTALQVDTISCDANYGCGAGTSSAPLYNANVSKAAVGQLNQQSANQWAGTCSIAAGSSSCSLTMNPGYLGIGYSSQPGCIVTLQGTTAITTGSPSCSFSSSPYATVTVHSPDTAAHTFMVAVIGLPN